MMMIGQSMAGLEGLTCYENSGMHFPSSRAGWDTCRAPDFNTAFNDGVDLIAQCDQSHYGRLVALWPNLCETTASNIMKHAGYDGPAIKCYDNVSGWRTTLFNLSPHRPSKKQASSGGPSTSDHAGFKGHAFCGECNYLHTVHDRL